MTIDDERLGAGERKSIARPLRLHRDFARTMFAAFVDGERDEEIARGDLRQHVARALGARASHQRGGAEERGRQERRGRQIAADRFHDDAGFDVAEAGTAMRFRDQKAAEAHFGEPLPKFAREARGIAIVAQLTQMRDRRFVHEETLRAVAQLGLFFVENERHVGFSGLKRLAARECVWR